MKIILASGSPRRRQLLEQVGLRGFVVRASDVDESVRPGLTPAEMVEELSARKAAAVVREAPKDGLVLAADTVVALEGAVLGKPASPEEAARMLAALSGRTHQVYTGLTLAGPGAVRTEHEVTAVTFRALSGAEIAAYVATGEPWTRPAPMASRAWGRCWSSGWRATTSTSWACPCAAWDVCCGLSVWSCCPPTDTEKENRI